MLAPTVLAGFAVGQAPAGVRFSLAEMQQVYARGQTVRVELVARNVSERPAVLMKVIWDGSPAARAMSTLYRDARQVDTFGDSSFPMAQVMVGTKVTADRFWTLKPGEKRTLFFEEYEGEFDFQGASTRYKGDYARAAKGPLKPGSYRFVVSYDFDPKAIVEDYKRLGPGYKVELVGDARRLWREAVPAKVKLEGRFIVQ